MTRIQPEPARASRRAEAERAFQLANVAFDQGDLKGAARAYGEASRLDKGFAAAHSNLGDVLRLLGRIEDSLKAYRLAVRADPDNGPIHYNFGIALEGAGRLAEAVTAYEQSLAQDPTFVAAYNNLALVAKKLGNPGRAIACLERAVALAPGNLSFRRNLQQALSERVPAWHFPMMNAAPRNAAYEAAIRRHVTPASHVLDIGTGSALLAMMAARAGAAHVTACEAVEEIAATARRIVAANGYGDRITILAKHSTDLVVGRDLPRRADLLVSGILSSDLVGEQVIRSLRHAHEHLLMPGAPAIPAVAEAVACLVDSDAMAANFTVGTVSGFDLSAFNRLRMPVHSMDLRTLVFERLSTPVPVVRLVYPFETPPPTNFTTDFPVTRSGRSDGIAQWIRLVLDDATTLDNDPPPLCGRADHGLDACGLSVRAADGGSSRPDAARRRSHDPELADPRPAGGAVRLISVTPLLFRLFWLCLSDRQRNGNHDGWRWLYWSIHQVDLGRESRHICGQYLNTRCESRELVFY